MNSKTTNNKQTERGGTNSTFTYFISFLAWSTEALPLPLLDPC